MNSQSPHNGLLLIDKPSGITSHDVVSQVRRALGMKAVGHSGTLDPLASGLMVVLLGEATKLSNYVTSDDKSYRAKVRLGISTDSYDITGKVLSEKPVNLSFEEVRQCALSLQGDLELQIPAFSAKKVDGKKLYELAHKNIPVDAPKKIMNFYNVEVIDQEATSLTVNLSCSKGGFIRSWVVELGERLGVGATLEELRRTASGAFTIEKAISPSALAEINPIESEDFFVEVEHALPHWLSLTVGGRDEKLLKNGQISHDLSRRLIFKQKQVTEAGKTSGVKVLDSQSKLLGLIEVAPRQSLKIKRIFNF